MGPFKALVVLDISKPTRSIDDDLHTLVSRS